MHGDDDEGEKFAAGGDEGDAPAAVAQVEAVADESGEGVANEGGEEDEGGDGVGEVVVAGDLGVACKYGGAGEVIIMMGESVRRAGGDRKRPRSSRG